MRARYRRRRAAWLLPLALALATVGAACSSSPDESAELTTPGIDGRGVSADDVVWQVFRGTVDFSPAVQAQEVADLTVYGDGRAFVADPTTTSGPRTIELGTIPADDLAAFLTTAQDSGLLEPGTDFGATDRTDLPLTTVVLADGSIPLIAAVPGLSADDLDLEPAQQDARDGVASLVAESLGLVVDAEPWTPDQLRALHIGPDAEPEIDADAAVEWPGPPFADFPPPDELSGTACLLIGEAGAEAVWTATLANPGATWIEQDELRQIVVAPVLPGEEGCPHDHDDEAEGDDHQGEDDDGSGLITGD